MKFEWYPAKAESNLTKHGVSFDEAATVFNDPLSDIQPDLMHSADEARFIILGSSSVRNLLVVVFTEIGDTTRLISAREATPKERRRYETFNPFT
jgi:uncharacterized protein